MKRLALFDFDGTVTYKDTFVEFMKYYRGASRFYWGMMRISPWLVGLKFGLIANWRVKERALTYFFKNEPLDKFNRVAEDFCREKLPALLKADAVEQIKAHQNQHDRVILISASAENWLRPWTEQVGIELLATQLEVKNGKLTGRIKGKNCHGIEKCNRLHQLLKPKEYEEIHAYGDTRGDREMLALAHFPNYRRFSGNLSKEQ